jgi:hypothetical protein
MERVDRFSCIYRSRLPLHTIADAALQAFAQIILSSMIISMPFDAIMLQKSIDTIPSNKTSFMTSVANTCSILGGYITP